MTDRPSPVTVGQLLQVLILIELPVQAGIVGEPSVPTDTKRNAMRFDLKREPTVFSAADHAGAGSRYCQEKVSRWGDAPGHDSCATPISADHIPNRPR
jgi:hypothetical protein